VRRPRNGEALLVLVIAAIALAGAVLGRCLVG
jgi:hypothetical protein